MRGVVSQFDDAAGLGEVTADAGTVYGFHCTQIADGTRTIAVGTSVEFDLAPWHRGRYEAVAVSPAP